MGETVAAADWLQAGIPVKELFSDPDTGMAVAKMTYRAGLIARMPGSSAAKRDRFARARKFSRISHHLWGTDDDQEGKHTRKYRPHRPLKVGVAAAIHFETLIPWPALCNARARRAGEGIGHTVHEGDDSLNFAETSQGTMRLF